jgi:LuxR family transcriptional regulator, transcriptional regulator of spore coat protein
MQAIVIAVVLALASLFGVGPVSAPHGYSPTVSTLTPRHRELLMLLAEGKTRKEMAAELHVSVHTISAELSSLYFRVGARNNAHAVALWKEGRVF